MRPGRPLAIALLLAGCASAPDGTPSVPASLPRDDFCVGVTNFAKVSDALWRESTPTNLLGRAACRDVNARRGCYYSLFQSVREQERGAPRRCPSCGRAPRRFDGFSTPQRLCDRCSLVWWSKCDR
jgi:hypothetical protein